MNGKQISLQAKLDEMDSEARTRYQDLGTKFHKMKIDSVRDILSMIGQVVGALWDDIVDHKKADTMLKALGLAATLQKDYLTVDFPDDVIKQYNAEMDKYKTAVAHVHKELLCPECFKKVSERLGWR